MTPTEKHRETAKDIAFDFDCDWTADGRRRGDAEYHAAIDAIAAALAKAEREASANLIGIIADIRQKSGVGGKPMLGELADAIEARIEEARREGMKRAAEIAREHIYSASQWGRVDDELKGGNRRAEEIAAAIFSEAEGE